MTGLPLSAQALREKFGSSSHIYFDVKKNLEFLFQKVKDKPRVKAKTSIWSNAITPFYGYKPNISLFLDHTYLNILTKIIVYLNIANRPNPPCPPLPKGGNRDEIIEVISGKYFVDKGITNFLEKDFSLWLLSTEIEDKSSTLFGVLCKELTNYDFSKIDEDIFRDIYEDIVEHKERHQAGEYYTPEWLVQLILNDVLALWKEKKGDITPKILDSACGSGVFLYRTIRYL